jgi:hypothetical protein
MVLEPIIGFLICGALLLFSRFYLAYFHSEAERQPEFEQWIAGQPLVMALQCESGRGVEVLYRLRAGLGGGEFQNPAGGYPWQHYVVRLEARRLTDDVVVLYAVDAHPRRERDRSPVLSAWLEALAPVLGPDVASAWMHGRLRGPRLGVSADRERVGWSARFTDAGLELEPMIGQPAWLATTARAA